MPPRKSLSRLIPVEILSWSMAVQAANVCRFMPMTIPSFHASLVPRPALRTFELRALIVHQ